MVKVRESAEALGKSCLLDALRDEPWQKHVSPHGIEIEPVEAAVPKVAGTLRVPFASSDAEATDDVAQDAADGTRRVPATITLNAWDFGGQKVYRPTHQLFFSSPEVYLVVWKPREGPQERQPDIDLQDLRDKFGADCVLGSFHVDDRPSNYDEATDTWSGERKDIAELKHKIANVAAAVRAQGATLRELHALLKAKDTAGSFGGLARVQNKRREFLWVHPQFVGEY